MSEVLEAESATIALPATKVEVDVNIQRILDHLAEEGFRPQLDDDGSIGFKCEGWKLYIDSYDSNGGFRLYCCVYWQLEPDERTKALIVANTVNMRRQCVKTVVNDKNTVWATYETHCADAAEFSRTLANAAIGIVGACREFREEFRRESQPVTLN